MQSLLEVWTFFFFKILYKSKWSRSLMSLCDPWTVAHQAPPSMGFSRQEHWSGFPFPSTGDLPDPGIKPRSPTLRADALTSAPQGKPLNIRIQVLTSKISREERKPGGRKKREEAGEGGWNVSCHLQIPRRYGTFPWASREGTNLSVNEKSSPLFLGDLFWGFTDLRNVRGASHPGSGTIISLIDVGFFPSWARRIAEGQDHCSVVKTSN